MRSQSEEPDAIGWKAAFSTLVECKATRADFRSDLRKGARQHMMFGMGVHRYYMTPKGLIESEEVPQGWGLLEVAFTGRVSRTVESARWTLCPIALRNELGLALSGLRRYQDEERRRCGA
jgi:hypothetical protein